MNQKARLRSVYYGGAVSPQCEISSCDEAAHARYVEPTSPQFREDLCLAHANMAIRLVRLLTGKRIMVAQELWVPSKPVVSPLDEAFAECDRMEEAIEMQRCAINGLVGGGL